MRRIAPPRARCSPWSGKRPSTTVPDIRINVLCPGPVDTPLIWDSAAAFPDPARAVSDVAQKTLMKRLGSPDDIARAALFLASEESGWVTGTSLTIDGGIMTGA